MSASTVSITANPSTATRRRAVEKKPLELTDTHNFSTAAAAAASPAAENGTLTLGDTHATPRDAVVQVRKSLPNIVVPPRRASNTARKHGSKPEKPRWKTVLSILVKNLLLFTVVIGWIFMVKELTKGKFKSAGVDNVPKFEGNTPKMEEFVTSMAKTMKMMQVQVDVIDRKIGEEIATVKDVINEKIERKNAELETKLTELDGRTLSLEKFAGELGGGMERWLSKEEFNKFLEEFIMAKGGEALSLDEVRGFAKGIVEKEIEKHAADGLGRVDYALASSGGMVVKHSEPLVGRGSGNGLIWLANQCRDRVHSEAEKMLRPSFGEPGQCFPLKGSSGFVQIRLRTAIIPTAVTLEHVAESVAYDRSSAPKDCRVSGWLRGQGLTDIAAEDQKMLLLTEFTYDLQKRNIQTFDVVESARSSIVDTVMFEFTSNHGSASHTCIYRLRVHGDEPNSVSLLTSQAS